MGAVKLATSMGSELQDAADQTGDTVENLGALKAIAEEASLSLEDLLTALFRFQKDGGKGVEEFAAKIDALAESPDAAAQAFELFGKAGAKMLRLARSTEGGLQGMINQLKEAGVLMSGADAKAADTFGDSLSRLELMGKLAVAQIGNALIPALQKFVTHLTGGAMQLVQFVKANREVAITVAGAAIGLIAAGAAVAGLGIAFVGASVGIAAVVTVLTGVASAAAFLFTPVGALVGIVAALAAGFIYLWSTNDQAKTFIGNLINGFRDLAGRLVISFEAIKAAISAGDWDTALRIGLLRVLVEWEKFKNDFILGWESFQRSIGTSWDEFWDGFSKGFQLGWEKMIFKLKWVWRTFIFEMENDPMGLGSLVQWEKEDFDKRIANDFSREFPGKNMREEFPEFFRNAAKPPAAGGGGMRGLTAEEQAEHDRAMERFRKREAMARELEALENKAFFAEHMRDLMRVDEVQKSGPWRLGGGVAGAVKGVFEGLQKVTDGLAAEVKGTFSSSALPQSLAIGNTLSEKMLESLRESEKANKETADLLKKMKGLVAE